MRGKSKIGIIVNCFLICIIFIQLLSIKKAGQLLPDKAHAQYPTATLTPTETPTLTPTGPTLTPTSTPVLSSTPTATVLTPTPTVYSIYGWVYTEQNDFVNPPEESGEGLLGGLDIALSGDAAGSQTSQGVPIGGIDANYQFVSLDNGRYQLTIQVTPTGSVLYGGKTQSQIAFMTGGDVRVDFPFITITPSPEAGIPTITPPGGETFPSSTPSPTPLTATPTNEPTPTTLWTPTPTGPTLTPGSPTLTPIPCQTLPTPVLGDPAHELCTNQLPTFQAQVANPNNDNIWAQFYSNSFESFQGRGSIQPSTGGTSEWIPYAGALQNTGGYWWTSFAESTSCPRSEDAPSYLLNIDRDPPPKPQTPTCVMIAEDLAAETCTFDCSWQAANEVNGSCSNTNNYHPLFWNTPGPGGWDPGWIGNQLSQIVADVPDGDLLYVQLSAADGANPTPGAVGNISEVSSIGGPFDCDTINYSISPTPGGPSFTPAPTLSPTVTPTPTITLTPTPGPWIQVFGGDVYEPVPNLGQPIPIGKFFLNPLQPEADNPKSAGNVWSLSGTTNFTPGAVSSAGWEVPGALTNAYTFSFYWETLKDKATGISNATVGDVTTNPNPELTDANIKIFSYSGLGYYTLDPNFATTITNNNRDVTIFIISGSLEITQNFTTSSSVVFIVNGSIFIDGNVTDLSGLFISSQTFTAETGSDPLTINGMVYAKSLRLNRSFHSFDEPTYQIIYQPKYIISLLPYLGRSEINWKEVQP